MAPPITLEHEDGVDMTEFSGGTSSPPDIQNDISLSSSSPAYHTTTAGSVIPIAPRRSGMYVTARNLTMTVGTEKKNNVKNILSDLNFFLKPGSMVLILGSPGCGKTSIMKALACQTHDERLSGKLLFNGKEPNPDTHHRDCIYVVQEDHHMAPFTVKETFKFSADMQMPEGTTEEQKNQRVETIMKMLGLESQADTIVGNEFLRGISGGQKKRVTIGVEFVKDANLILLDECSTGLDSTTTLDLITNIKEIVTTQNVSCIVSLLQPGSEIVRLFDFLMVLSEGQMAYFGPMNSGIDYFEELGFKLPSHHNPAEFFQEIVDEPELYYAKEGEPPLKGTQQFAQAYKNSEICKKVCDDLDNNIPNPSDFKDSSHMTAYPTSTGYQILKTSLRAFKMLVSNPVVVRVRIIKSIVMGLILGSLFWDLSADQAGGNNRSGLIFFSLLFVIFGGFGSITVLTPYFALRDGHLFSVGLLDVWIAGECWKIHLLYLDGLGE
ncbi:ABC transporter G family protein [Cavenderia fasciculata]|uniref:ABC transporter G family protein n=1 Tax=Cavenderia fasciculata TaxID=261658 RepID=F4PZX2_CACFS|nr:ABC transporter G family protein [Cavenderia fasciculata]EGG18886.1 ABC transporter G family protein [Cavenderia fasciculata]|eukprot:XP_004357348.1 ABC transporter G family protein [Cavenderia fasciculata]